MKAAFGDDFDGLSFLPAGSQQVALLINWKSCRRPQRSAVFSDGTLRFLYLITILANPSPPALIAIDEPITGLHPSMVPIIAEFARNASRRAQIILTTHSEDFLDTICEYGPTVTIANMESGKTRLNVLEGESLRYWMKGSAFNRLKWSGEPEGIA
jgi:predicted ATPase